MPAISGAFSALMAPGLRKVIMERYGEQSQVFPRVFNVLSSSKQYEVDRQITGFGTIPTKLEGEAITYSDPLQSYTKTYTHLTYGMGIRITEEMYEDDLYGVAKRWANALGRSARATVETIGANILNNGFSDTGPDGVSLFNASHALKAGGTSANRPGTDADLTVASLEAAIIAFMNMKDDQSLLIEATPRVLLVNPSDLMTANKLVQSAQQPFIADNQKNVIGNYNLQVIAWPYLTDTDAWFLLGDKAATELNFFWRRQPSVKNDDDFDTGDALYKITFRCSAGYSDWRNMYGTSGA